MTEQQIAEVIAEAESIVTGQYGSGQVTDLIPPEAPVTYYRHHYGPTWGDVADAFKSVFESTTPKSIPSPSWIDTLIAVEQGIFHAINIVATFTNLNADYTHTAVSILGQVVDLLLNQIVDSGVIFANLIHNLDTKVQLLTTALQLEDQIVQSELEAQILQTQANVVAVLQQWSYDHIFTPLYENIGQAEAQATAQANAVEAKIAPTAQAIATSTVAPALAAIATMAPAITALQKVTDDCTTPMCETMGPKTDLGKLLKALNVASAAAFFAELAALDRNGLEAVLRLLQHAARGVVDDVNALFVEGGHALGASIPNV